MNPFIIGCSVYFGLLIVISTVFRQRLTGFLDFFLAGKHLPMWMMTVSVLAAWIGAASTMGTMTLAYTEGFSAYWLLAIPTVTAMCVNGFILAKVIRQSEMTTIPEAVAQHYGLVASMAYSLVIYLATTTLIGSQLVACGGLFEHILGVPMQQSVPWVYLAIVVYSIIGGFRAVVLTDLVQFAVLFISMFIATYFVQKLPIISPQALQPVIPGITQFKVLWAQDLSAHVAMTLTFTLSWSIAPELWQRLAALPSAKEAKKMVLYASGVFLVFFTMVVMAGYWAQGRIDVADVSQLKTGGNIFFLLVSKMPNQLLSTLMLVGVVAAIASTIDSSLNVACMTISKDVIGRFVWPKMSSAHEVLLSRLATIVVGLPAMAVAVFYQDLVKILWISADIYASAAFIPVIGLFYWQRGRNPISGILAICFGLIPVFIEFLGHDLLLFPLPTWWPGAPYTTLIGIAMCALGYGLGIILNPRDGCNSLPIH